MLGTKIRHSSALAVRRLRSSRPVSLPSCGRALSSPSDGQRRWDGFLTTAAELRILAGKDSVDAATLQGQSGMPLRRFNPALGFIIAQIDDRHVSKEIDNTYPSRYLLPDAADRVSLRRFVEQSGG